MSYITPPTELHHSFSSDNSERSSAGQPWVYNRLAPFQQRSPPVSPDARVLPSIDSLAAATSALSTDPPLYPDESTNTDTSQEPLFRRSRGDSQTTASPPPQSTVLVARPSVSTSNAALFPQRLGITTPTDALNYWRDCVRGIEECNRASNVLPDPRHLRTAECVERDSTSQDQVDRVNHSSHRVTKTRAAPKQSPKTKTISTIAANASPTKATPARRRTPKPRANSAISERTFSQSQQSNKHTRAAPSKKVENDHVHWSELPDYCPPLSSLGDQKLEAKWAHNPLKMDDHPDRVHLHDQEFALAQRLRLYPDQYLSNKRKIFAARFQSIKDNKNFTKTAAQAACSIDVNKASQLWEAYDKVGWFKESWFEKWL